MIPIQLSGVKRPGLRALLAERGLAVRTSGQGCLAALIAEDAARPVCPAVIEAGSDVSAGMLLDGGADDVVLRSDGDALVAARLAALVRRSQPLQVQYGAIVIDTVERWVTLDGRPLALLPREYALLQFLARHGGSTVAHATLHRALWGRAFDPGTNVIAVHISRLRAKLNGSAVAVVTERGKGYRLQIAERPAAG